MDNTKFTQDEVNQLMNLLGGEEGRSLCELHFDLTNKRTMLASFIDVIKANVEHLGDSIDKMGWSVQLVVAENWLASIDKEIVIIGEQILRIIMDESFKLHIQTLVEIGHNNMFKTVSTEHIVNAFLDEKYGPSENVVKSSYKTVCVEAVKYAIDVLENLKVDEDAEIDK